MQARFRNMAQQVDQFLEEYFHNLDLPPFAGITKLKEAMSYSVLAGGKRFRPVLSLLTAEALGGDIEKVMPFAASVEMVHTYSLIHDDLPAMDNDDLRRGRPTNHKVFGESFALLAGDGLLSEAFSVLATHYLEEPSLLASLLDALTRAVGIHGMVGGQSMDLVGMEGGVSQRLELETLHKLKTGALIQVSAVGSAIICGAGGEKLEQVGRFAQGLGLAFQVWDDLLDYDSESVEKQSFPGVLGIEASREYLRALNESTLSQLESWGTGADSLRWLVHYNETRSH